MLHTIVEDDLAFGFSSIHRHLYGVIVVPGTGFEPVTSGHKALAPYKLQIMSLAP